MAQLQVANNPDGSMTFTVTVTADDLPSETALVAQLRGAVQPLLDAAGDLSNQANVITTAAEKLNQVAIPNDAVTPIAEPAPPLKP